MKRFMVFFGHNYYPKGGMNDFITSFKSIKAAVNKAEKLRQKWPYPEWGGFDLFGHVYDIEERAIVWKNGNFIK